MTDARAYGATECTVCDADCTEQAGQRRSVVMGPSMAMRHATMATRSMAWLFMNCVVEGNEPAEPTCNDGIQNQNEAGVDCGEAVQLTL